MRIDLADLSDSFVDYVLREGHREVEGWIEPGALAVTTLLDRLQVAAGVRGGLAEIGVHHGRYFIALRLLARSGERTLALDIFEDQHLNLDRSGLGSRKRLTANLMRHAGSLDGVEILKADSLTVRPEHVLQRLGGPVRIFSVDGCHTAAHTESDIRLAAAVLAPGGVVIVDDIFNPEWPGVLAGVEAFFCATDRPGLVPIIATDNKLILCQKDAREPYWAGLQAFLAEVQGEVGTRRLLGFEVIDQPFPGLDLFLETASHARAFGRPLIRAMRLTAATHPAYRFGSGWSTPESWGTWSDGTNAGLTLRLDPPLGRALVIEALAQGFVGAAHPRLEVEVRANGAAAAVWLFEGDSEPRTQRIRIPAELVCVPELELDFHIGEPRSPRELLLSDDARRLGLGLRTLKVLQGD